MIYVIAITYFWAGFWTACIALMDESAPRNPVLKVFGGFFVMLLWPVFLPVHLSDMSKT